MSSERAGVELDGVWKRYLLGEGRGAKGVLLDLLGRGGARDLHWALSDLHLRVEQGECVGLVGRNGAGKTTALKLVAGITRASRGTLTTSGRVASLINVGAGFHRELTGRENVLLNAVILGLTRREAQERYDEIVAFAGLEGFMETPVKQYSTGMFARLGFSVATHVDPSVLLVDEVLSVGDASFQDRSMRRMLRFRDGGTAILFVSHNLSAVELMCQRVVWLDHGRVRAIGPTSEVLRAYLDDVDASAGEEETSLVVDDVSILDGAGRPASELDPTRGFWVDVRGRAVRDLIEPVFVVTVRGDYGPLFAGNMHIDGSWPARIPAGPFRVACDFGSVALMPGVYRVELKVKQNVRTNYFEPRIVERFCVPGHEQGQAGGRVPAVWELMETVGVGESGIQ